MQKFVRFTAPTNALDFIFKLCVFLVVCGGLNHTRDVIQNGFSGRDTFASNLIDATYTALPMCSFALMLIGHLNTLHKQLYRQSNQDQLTGLHNRRWFMDKTSEMLGGDQALIIIDVDHFKAVNDTFGHDVGDRCLIAFAAHLRDSIGEDDLCARIGGEEFVVLVQDAELDRIHRIAQRISAGFEFEIGNGVSRQVTTSVGVALGLHRQPRAKALRSADEAVYRVKSQGRARYEVTWLTDGTDTPVLQAALA